MWSISLDKASEDLLAELVRGGEMIFDNAEQLYKEACILRENGALSRALCLHQLSNEECGKLEMLGGYAMTITLGHQVDMTRMTKTLRDHEAKNHANAYFTSITEDERAARERGDWAGSSRAFEELQAKLHKVFNTHKNAALYVNFEGGKFSAPKDVITAEMVEGMAALNAYFLGITGPYVRLLRRVQSNEWGMRDAGPAFVQRVKELRAQMPNDPEAVFKAVFQEMLERMKARSTDERS
jgi:AbiV family abortive infection protein